MPPAAPAARLTHFLCLPLVTSASRPHLEANLRSFRAEVTQATAQNPSGIPERAVRPAGTLHLTLGVMSLVTPGRIEAALTLLQSPDLRGQMPSRGREDVGHASSRPAPLTVTLRGLKTTHEPKRTSVMFAPPVDEDGSLYEFCVRIRNAFQAAGLLVSDTRPLLLHATIINTVYVGGRGRKAPKLTIDAREIMQQYESFEWLKDIRIETVAICKMGAQPVMGGDEAYIVEGEVPVPG